MKTLHRSLLTLLVGALLATTGPGPQAFAARPVHDEGTGATPQVRASMGFAYDAGHRQIVLFGGITGGLCPLLGDTWIWDGTSWEERFPADAPSPRAGTAMAYDAARRQVVLFGGATSCSGGLVGDTWIWDGSSWTQAFPPASPSPRAGMGMAYDKARHEVVLFGGVDANGHYFNATWVWDGTTWIKRHPTASPTQRASMGLAYDATHREVVLFGGFFFNPLNDTWTWDGSTWKKREPTTSPETRWSMGLANDPIQGGVVMFGGRHATYLPADLNDTWLWDGSEWTELHPGISPHGRFGMGMAYEAARHDIVIFGGAYGEQKSTYYLGDTWSWDGSDWTVVG